MKIIKYIKEIPASIEKDASGVEHIIRDAYLQEEGLYFTEENKDVQVAEALKIAYNGEYEIVDDGEPEPPPTTNERISVLEEQLAQSDETAIALYEAQEAQAVINAQQDEALMQIYEMIG